VLVAGCGDSGRDVEERDDEGHDERVGPTPTRRRAANQAQMMSPPKTSMRPDAKYQTIQTPQTRSSLPGWGSAPPVTAAGV
jgi:hypothetical protein